jgi:DNA-binding transcriptional MerR regulator
MEPQGKLRIGELSRRTGASPSVLRAWEKRYGLITPVRSTGGLRLFSADDEARIVSMQHHMKAGLSAAEAARAVIGGVPAQAEAPRNAEHRTAEAASSSELAEAAAELRAALRALEPDAAQRTIDRLLAVGTFDVIARDVLMPYLAELGSRWREGDASIAEEHLATHVLRGRLLGLLHSGPPAAGPGAILASPPEELHDMALLILAVALQRRGWRIVLLGSDSPIETVREAAARLDLDYVVIAATKPERLSAVRGELADLAADRRLMLAGPGADQPFAASLGAEVLDGDPISAASQLSKAARSSITEQLPPS